MRSVGNGWRANPYIYAFANPLCLIDPSGTQPASLPQDADGNYIMPGEVIRIYGTAPSIDELEIQKRGGASHYDSRAEVERQLRIQHKTNTSDTSWLKPPPGPDWDAAGMPELAEEARAEAEAKWDAYVTKEYQKRRDAKVVELGKQQRRISTAYTAGKIIGGVTVAATAVIGGAAAVGYGFERAQGARHDLSWTTTGQFDGHRVDGLDCLRHCRAAGCAQHPGVWRRRGTGRAGLDLAARKLRQQPDPWTTGSHRESHVQASQGDAASVHELPGMGRNDLGWRTNRRQRPDQHEDCLPASPDTEFDRRSGDDAAQLAEPAADGRGGAGTATPHQTARPHHRTAARRVGRRQLVAFQETSNVRHHGEFATGTGGCGIGRHWRSRSARARLFARRPRRRTPAIRRNSTPSPATPSSPAITRRPTRSPDEILSTRGSGRSSIRF